MFSLAHFFATFVLLLAPAIAYRADNLPCRAHFQCLSGFCNGKRLCQAQQPNFAACLVHEACISGRCGQGGVCQDPMVNGTGPCAVHEDCIEGFCNFTTVVCDAWKPKQDSCQDDFECRSGRCFANPPRCEFVSQEGAICGKDNDCLGDRCKKIEEGGDNRCYPRKWNHQFCNHNSDCLSLRCETRNCTEPVWVGSPCDEPSDCYSLFCNKEKGCVATADEADTDEIEPEKPGVSGSLAQMEVNGGGNVDIGTGTTFDSQNGGSSGESTMGRVMIAAVIGMMGAAVAVMV